MRTHGKIEFEYFRKGTYVRTPNGVGIVCKTEKKIKTPYELIASKVKIQHKYGWSNNPSNLPINQSRSNLIRIPKEEYKREQE